MAVGTGWLCKKHRLKVADGAYCYGCIVEENEALRADCLRLEQEKKHHEDAHWYMVGLNNRYRAALEAIGCRTDHGDQEPCEICRIVDAALEER